MIGMCRIPSRAARIGLKAKVFADYPVFRTVRVVVAVGIAEAGYACESLQTRATIPRVSRASQRISASAIHKRPCPSAPIRARVRPICRTRDSAVSGQKLMRADDRLKSIHIDDSNTTT